MNKTINSGPTPSDLVELGKVVSAYGVMGWVKLQPHSAQAEVLRKAKTWWLSSSVAATHRGEAAPVAYSVVKVRSQGASLVAQLAGIDDRDQAESLRGSDVFAPRSLFPKAEQDEYYWVDLIGCSLFGDDNGHSAMIGEVLEVLDNGAHGILRVGLMRDRSSADTQTDVSMAQDPVAVLDAKGRQAETLVPFVAAHIRSVDLAARRIDSDWPLDI